MQQQVLAVVADGHWVKIYCHLHALTYIKSPRRGRHWERPGINRKEQNFRRNCQKKSKCLTKNVITVITLNPVIALYLKDETTLTSECVAWTWPCCFLCCGLSESSVWRLSLHKEVNRTRLESQEWHVARWRGLGPQTAPFLSHKPVCGGSPRERKWKKCVKHSKYLFDDPEPV